MGRKISFHLSAHALLIVPCGTFNFEDTRVALFALPDTSETLRIDTFDVERRIIERVEPDTPARWLQSKRAEIIELDLLKTGRNVREELDMLEYFACFGIGLIRHDEEIDRGFGEYAHLDKTRLIHLPFRVREERAVHFRYADI